MILTKKEIITMVAVATVISVGLQTPPAKQFIADRFAGKEQVQDDGGSRPEIHERSVTYYSGSDGQIIYAENSDGQTAEFKWAQVETRRDDDGLYMMLVYAESTKGFEPDFEDMKIAGIGYYNDDGHYVDGDSIRLSDGSGDAERYLLTLTSDREFTLDSVDLSVYNFSNEAFDSNTEIYPQPVSLSDVDLHRTFDSPTHFISVNGHYYVWDQTVPKKNLGQREENTYSVAITEDTIIWTGEGGSVEELFTELYNNSSWALENGGETYETEYAELTLEELDGKLCLVKTVRTDMEEPEADPNYIAYTEPGYGTMYFTII